MAENRRWRIRPVTEDELPQLRALWVVSELDHRPKGRDSLKSLQVERRDNPDGIIGAFIGDEMIGSVIASDDGRRGWIHRLAVHPEHRGTGLGEALIREAERVLSDRGRQIIAALIEDHNVHSQNLFKRMGYVVMPEVLYFSKRTSPDV